MSTGSASSPNDHIEPLNRQQIRIYRQMTGERRLLLSLDMIRSTWRIAADAIRGKAPGISERELRTRIRDRRIWASSRPR
jgi:hypothetical protein